MMRGPHFVYALIDPRNQQIFYIGITIAPQIRMRAHRGDPCSSAWKRIREIEASGYECEMEIMGEFESRNDALALEYEFINYFPELVNIDRALHRVGAAA